MPPLRDDRSVADHIGCLLAAWRSGPAMSPAMRRSSSRAEVNSHCLPVTRFSRRPTRARGVATAAQLHDVRAAAGILRFCAEDHRRRFRIGSSVAILVAADRRLVRETSPFGRKPSPETAGYAPASWARARVRAIVSLASASWPTGAASAPRSSSVAAPVSECGQRQRFQPGRTLFSSLPDRAPDRSDRGHRFATRVRDRALDEQRLRKIDAFAVWFTTASA